MSAFKPTDAQTTNLSSESDREDKSETKLVEEEPDGAQGACASLETSGSVVNPDAVNEPAIVSAELAEKTIRPTESAKRNASGLWLPNAVWMLLCTMLFLVIAVLPRAATISAITLPLAVLGVAYYLACVHKLVLSLNLAQTKFQMPARRVTLLTAFLALLSVHSDITYPSWIVVLWYLVLLICSIVHYKWVAAVCRLATSSKGTRGRFLITTMIMVPTVIIDLFVFESSYVWPAWQFFLFSILALSQKQPIVQAEKTRNVVGQGSCLELQYDSSSALEKWLRQRSTGTKYNAKITSIALVTIASLLALLKWSTDAANKYVSAHEHTGRLAIHASQSIQAAVSGTDSPSKIPLAILLTMALIVLGFVWFLLLRWLRPKILSLSAEGIALKGPRLFAASRILRWDDIREITLKRGKTHSSLDHEVRFVSQTSKMLRIKLGNLQSPDDRDILLKSIKQWGARTERDASVYEALQLPADHSYTEFWLQALTAPPKRAQLKPLIPHARLRDGSYEVIRSLGVGGQGFAYLANDILNEQQIVLKEFILPVYVTTSVRRQALEQFESEAKILQSLRSNQIVRLIDFFVEDHRAYLVLEYIPGSSLRDLIEKNGAMDEESVIYLCQQMCQILSYLHSLVPPIVHRDFTPDNLIVNEQGQLKLIDFNVAQQEEEGVVGSMVGKLAYLPPEQFRGEASSQSDIYALGATLHYLLTGQDPEPIACSHPIEINPNVSNELSQIVSRATEPDTLKRFQKIADFQKALQPILSTQPFSYKQSWSAAHESSVDSPIKLRESANDIVSDGSHSSIDDQLVDRQLTNQGQSMAQNPSAVPGEMNTAAPVTADLTFSKNALRGKLSALSTVICVLAILPMIVWTFIPSQRPLLDPDYVKRRAQVRTAKLMEQVADQYNARLFLGAEKILDKVIAERPDQPIGYVWRGWTRLKRTMYKDALADAEKVLSLSNQSSAYNAHVLKATALVRMKRYAEAARVLQIHTDQVKADAEALEEYGYAVLKSDKADKAKLLLDQLIALEPNGAENIYHRAVAEEAMDETKLAEVDLRKVLSIAGPDQFHLVVGVRNELKQLEEYSSKQAAKQDARTFIQTPIGRIRRAMFLEDWTTAERICTAEIFKSPNDPDLLLLRSQCYTFTKQEKKALADLDSCLKMDPDNSEALLLKFDIYKNMKLDDQAWAVINKLIMQERASALYVARGRIFYRKHDYDHALEDFQKAVDLSPKWAVALSERGAALAKLGRFDDSIEDLHAAVRNNALKLEELAQNYWRTAKIREAQGSISAKNVNETWSNDVGVTFERD